jgi:hypothetical protein
MNIFSWSFTEVRQRIPDLAEVGILQNGHLTTLSIMRLYSVDGSGDQLIWNNWRNENW